MIRINKDYYLDDNDQICENGQVDPVKNQRKKAIEILENFKYNDDKNERKTTYQFIGILKKCINKRMAENMAENMESLSKNTGKIGKILDELVNLTPNEITDTLGHIFRHDFKENFISDWLAYIFNFEKMGTNEPFQAIFDACGIAGTFIPIDGIDREKELFYVDNKNKRENCGRIDFFIRTETAIVGIENKIFSDFTTKNQLEKYYKAIKQIAEVEGKKPYLILLYPESNKKIVNHRNKHDEKDNIFMLTYKNLIEKFEKIKIDCVKSLRQMIIFEDFIKHIKEYIMNGNNIISFDTIKFLNDKNKEIALLDQVRSGANEQLKNYFEQCLKEKLKDETDEWDIHISSGCQFIQCYKKDWKERKVHFELKNIVKEEDSTNFPPKHFVLELHDEGKNQKIEIDNLSGQIKEQNKEKIEIDYSSLEKFTNSVNKLMKKLIEVVNEYAKKIDSALF